MIMNLHVYLPEIFFLKYHFLLPIAGEQLDVSWSSPVAGQEGHRGHFPLEWLRQKCYSSVAREERRRKGRPLIAVCYVITVEPL